MISLYKSLLNVLVIISNLADVNERRDDFLLCVEGREEALRIGSRDSRRTNSDAQTDLTVR